MADDRLWNEYLRQRQLEANRRLNESLDALDGLIDGTFTEALTPIMEKAGILAACIGGPVDGMLVVSAVALGRAAGNELFLPALLCLTGPHGEIAHVEHVYVRDGDDKFARYRYAGLRPISGVTP